MDGERIKLTSTTASGRRPHIPPICVNVLYKIIILTLENERFNSSNYFWKIQNLYLQIMNYSKWFFKLIDL